MAGRPKVGLDFAGWDVDIFENDTKMGFHGLYIELKRIKNGRATEEQRAWLKKLTAEGYLACICHGWQAAAEVITDYLNGKPKGETNA